MSKPITVSRGGENNSRVKLTWAQVDEIRALRGTMTQREIAKRFGITRASVNNIQRGYFWKPETRNCKTKSQIAADLVREFPSSSNRAIARGLVVKYPNLFRTENAARSCVNYVRGCSGEAKRRIARDKSLFREPARLV